MKLKKICCYMFVLLLVINAPISVYAQATSTTPTVTIAAGTGAAVGGAYQGYTSKTAAAATALTLAVLSATGAAVKLTEASVQAGKTVYQVINDKFAQWVGGTSAEELTPSQAEELQSRFHVITGGGGNSEDPDDNQDNGTNVGEDGKLWFSPGSLAMLKQFCDWLESKDQLKDYVTNPPGVGEYPGYYGQKYIFSQSATGEYSVFATVDDVLTNAYFVCYKERASDTSWFIGAYSTSSFRINRQNYGSGVGSASYQVGNMHYAMLSNKSYRINYVPDGWYDISTAGYYNYTGLRNFVNNVQPINQPSGIESDGIYKGENYDSSILHNPNNQVLVIDPGILNGFNIDSDRQIAIPDYIDLIIQQAEQKAKKDAQNDPSPAPQELPVPLIDPIEGTKSPANWIDPKPDDAIIDPIESEKRDPDPEDPKDPVIDEDTPTDPEDAVELLKVDLTRIFPFCIPWDLYRLFSKFNAEPVTPSITIDWGDILGAFGIDYVTTLDLHDYDNVASILRTMETVAFVVGLAVATRSIFLRS